MDTESYGFLSDPRRLTFYFPHQVRLGGCYLSIASWDRISLFLWVCVCACVCLYFSGCVAEWESEVDHPDGNGSSSLVMKGIRPTSQSQPNSSSPLSLPRTRRTSLFFFVWATSALFPVKPPTTSVPCKCNSGARKETPPSLPTPA